MIVRLPDGRNLDVVGVDDFETAKQRAREWYEENPPATTLGEEDISVFGDMARGIGSGLVSTIEGVSSLPAELYDYLADNEEDSAAQSIRDFFSEYKPEVHTGAGEAVKFITQFAIPGLGAVKAARAISGVSRLKRRVEIPAFAAADVLAATPDVETIGDAFEFGPTQRTDIEDLLGAERALAGLGNRLKVAGEGAGALLVAPLLLKGLGKGVGKGIDAISETETGKSLAKKLIKDPDSPYSSVGIDPDLNNPEYLKGNLFAQINKWRRENLTWAGKYQDRHIKQLEALKIQSIGADDRIARQAIEEIEEGIRVLDKSGELNDVRRAKLYKSVNGSLFQPDANLRAKSQKALSEFDEILNENQPLSLLGRKKLSFSTATQEFRKTTDRLSETLGKSEFFDPKEQKAYIDAINSNRGSYGIRIYRAFHDPENYVPSSQDFKNAIEELAGASASKEAQQEAMEILNNVMSSSSFRNANMQTKFMFDKDVLRGVNSGILKGRTLDDLPAFRAFLGEYTGAPELIGITKNADGTFKKLRDVTFKEQEIGLKTKMVETISHLTRATNNQGFFRNLNDYNNILKEVSPNRRIFYDKLPEGLSREQLGNYQQLGTSTARTDVLPSVADKNKYGPLAGKYVHKDMVRAIEDVPNTFLAQSHLNSSLWSTFLGLKGMSQLAKTVYSPVTQIRNATTAGLFVLQNGNLGSAKDLVDSFRIVYSNIAKNVDVDPTQMAFRRGSNVRLDKAGIENYYRHHVDTGLIQTQSKMREFEDLLRDSLEGKAGWLKREGSWARGLLKGAQNTQNRFAGKVYQASDDMWKIFSKEQELKKLRTVKNLDAIPVTDVENILLLRRLNKGRGGPVSQLKEADLERFLDREASSIAKDTVPNYSRVPEYIKTLRRLPLGNFVAFPAEIIRTSGNTLGRAVKEIASNSPELRASGMRRLVGMTTVNYGLGSGLVNGANLLLGSDNEQIQAYKRSFAQEWERNSILVPTSTDKDGNIKEFYNFSYTNPYDYLTRPVRALWNAVENGVTAEKDLTDIVLNATWESGREFFSPFLSESIMTEKMLDISRNTNAYGGNLWGDADPLGMKAAKGFAHFVDGLTPGMSPIEIEGTQDEAGFDIRFRDFPRAVGLAFGADPVTGVNRRGVRLDAAGEFVEALSGLKSIRPNIKEALKYRGYDAASQVRAASGIFNRLAKRSGNVDAEELTKAFLTSNEQRFKALRDLDMAVDDARTLGLSTSEIATSLKAAKTPNLNYVLAGKFKTFWPSSETINEAYRSSESKLKNPFDWNAMNEITTRMQGTPLRPEAAAREAEAMQQAQQQPAPVQPPAAPPQAAPPIPAPTPTASLSNRPSGLQALREAELQKLLGL